MEDTNNSIEEQTIPSLTEETKKAQGIKRWVLMGGIALAILLLVGSLYLAKGAVQHWFSSFSNHNPDHSKAASGIDLKDNSQPRDLEAEIPKAPQPAVADETTPQQPTKTADNSAQAKFNRMLHGECKNTGITYDIHGNPVVVCTDNANPAVPATSAARPARFFNRLDVPLAVANVKNGGGSYDTSSYNGSEAAGASGSGYPSGIHPLKQLDPNQVVNDYLQRVNANHGAAGMMPNATAQASKPAPSGKDEGVLAADFAASHLSGVKAAMLGDLNYIWAKGQGVDCVMDGAIDASVSGYTSCTVSGNVYSANGRTVLVEKGSTAFLEYHGISAIGQTRFPLIASSIRTPNGVTFNLDSGAQGPLGETGASGYVDNRWGDRLGAALLVALLGDVAQYEITKAQNNNGGTNIYQQSENVAQSIPGKILNTTINIKPRILKLQGETVRIVAARDVDFSTVYKLVAK